MTGHNVTEEEFQEIKISGLPALLNGQRFSHDSVPEGLYIYEVRHSGSMWDEPVQVAKCVINNFMGTLVTREPLGLQEDGCLVIKSTDWDFECGGSLTAGEFMDRYPPELYSHAVKENYTMVTKPETLLVWAGFSRPGFEISEKQAGLVLEYMELQGYALAVSRQQMAVAGITDGKTIPCCFDDVIISAYGQSCKMKQETASLLINRLFAQTVYGKECHVLAEEILAHGKSFRKESSLTYAAQAKKQAGVR